MCMHVCLCDCIPHVCAWSEEVGRSHVAEVTGVCEPPGLGARKQTSGRPESALNPRAITPALNYSKFLETLYINFTIYARCFH